jgi:hypothetical protein
MIRKKKMLEIVIRMCVYMYKADAYRQYNSF